MMTARRAGVAATTAGVAIALTVTTMAPATAVNGDRPKNVAAVRADRQVTLSADGTTITVVERVECDPGWVAAELDAQVYQDGVAYSSYVLPTVPCDGHWYTVAVSIPVDGPALQPGSVTITSQFLVTNELSGDSAGAHDSRTGHLRLAG